MEQQKLLGRSKSGKSSRTRSGLRSFVKACWSPPIADCGQCYEQGELLVVEQQQQQQLVEMRVSPLSGIPDDLLVECLARVPRGSLHTTMLVCRKWRSIVRSDSFYRVRQKLGRVESCIVVLGGVGAAIYSDSAGRWKRGEVLVSDVVDKQVLLKSQSQVLAAVKHRIFILPAAPNLHCSMVYDTWSRSVRRAAPMLCPRKKFACCVISNRILVAGGLSVSGEPSAVIRDAEEYIPELDQWRPMPSMPRRRYGCTGAAVNGIFYVIGGIKRPYSYVGSMDCFDPSTNSWLRSKPLPTGGGCVISCTVVGTSIYMLSSHAVELSFWRYDTRGEEWSRITLPPLPSPLRIDNLLKFSCVTVRSAVYIIQVGGSFDDLLRRGGRNPRGVREGLVLVYDTRSCEWSKRPLLPELQSSAAVCVVVDS